MMALSDILKAQSYCLKNHSKIYLVKNKKAPKEAIEKIDLNGKRFYIQCSAQDIALKYVASEIKKKANTSQAEKHFISKVLGNLEDLSDIDLEKHLTDRLAQLKEANTMIPKAKMTKRLNWILATKWKRIN